MSSTTLPVCPKTGSTSPSLTVHLCLHTALLREIGNAPVPGRGGSGEGGLDRVIEREDWTLNISRYVLPPIGEDIPPLPEAVAAFKKALAEARAAEDHLRRVLVEDGWLK